MELQIVRMKDVVFTTGLSKTTIYRLEKEGNFPKRVSLGARSVGWFKHDIQDFLKTRQQISVDSISMN